LLNDDYPDGVWVEPDYRAAVGDLERPAEGEPALSVRRNRLTPSGNPATHGVQYPDSITFF
jgi:hypothetical protein